VRNTKEDTKTDNIFSTGWAPFFGYHHLLMLLIAAAIILLCKLFTTPTQTHHLPHHPTNTPTTALLLAGCSSSSPGIPNIFLISFYYSSYTPTYSPTQVDPDIVTAIANIVGTAQLEVRVGYFGICMNADGGSWLCSNNATALAERIGVQQDPFNLVWVAQTFRDMVVFPYLL